MDDDDELSGAETEEDESMFDDPYWLHMQAQLDMMRARLDALEAFYHM